MATAAIASPTAAQQQQQHVSSHPFTCNTCQVAFRSSDLQRTHMQSDWHRYNLKRRVASLPPLTSDIFAEKVLANKASAAATAAKASFEKRCEACERTYYSENAYVNHLGSQKHRLLAARLDAKTGNETESLVDSNFSLGEPMDNASTTTESTLNGEARDVIADEDSQDVAERVSNMRLDAATNAMSPSAAPSISSAQDAKEDLEHHANLNQCLFCNYISPNLDLNINHMGRQHGFFIPEQDYLVDLEGLINYLSETVLVLHQCLFCHKFFHTGPGVQTHMRDRGHCMIAYTTEDEQFEIGEFYDFRSTYSDEDEESEDGSEANGGVSLGVKRAVKTTTQNAEGEDVDMGDDDEEGWESDSTVSSVPTDEITSVPLEQNHKFEKLNLHRHHSHTDPRPHKNTDGFHSHAHHTPVAVYHDDYELHLPSGRTAGHRSLRVYYRQNLRNYPTPEERVEKQRLIDQGRHDSDADEEDSDDDDDQRTETDRPARGRQVVSRANGGLGMIGVSDARKREVKAIETKALKRAERAQRRAEWAVNSRANNQKHFRDPLLQ